LGCRQLSRVELLDKTSCTLLTVGAADGPYDTYRDTYHETLDRAERRCRARFLS
jgi:hypothetical protein